MMLLPPSMAVLPVSKAIVWSGPPLSARVPRCGLATPTWLPLTPFDEDAGRTDAEQVVGAVQGDGAGGERENVVGRAASLEIGGDDRVVDRDGAAGDVEPAAVARGGDGVLGDRGIDRRERARCVEDAAARAPSCSARSSRW